MCSLNLFVPFIWRPLQFFGKSFPFSLLFLCFPHFSASFSTHCLVLLCYLTKGRSYLWTYFIYFVILYVQNLLFVYFLDDLTIDYQFTFNLSKKEDRHYTQINFKNSPPKPDVDADFSITCSVMAKMNVTMKTGNTNKFTSFYL